MQVYQKYSNEKALISKLKQGDQKAFDLIFYQYKERIYLFCLKFLKSSDLAEEIVHDVFLKIWEKRKVLDPQLSFNAYIHTICKNMVFNYLKKAVRHQALLNQIKESYLFDIQEDEEEKLNFEAHQLYLDKAIDLLPPKRKMIFQMCKLEGKSYQETAQHFNISRDAVKDHMIKAGKFVKEYVLSHSDLIITLALFLNLV
ncbi:MAG: RNA polymerase sigma factor [Candidatus Cyclobacteriaceae bacterium M3_2C_046]